MAPLCCTWGTRTTGGRGPHRTGKTCAKALGSGPRWSWAPPGPGGAAELRATTWGGGRWRPLPGTLGRPARFAPVRGQRGAQPRGSAHPQSIHCLLGDRTDGVKKDDSLFHSQLARASAPRGRQAGEAPQSLGRLLVRPQLSPGVRSRREDQSCFGGGTKTAEGWGLGCPEYLEACIKAFQKATAATPPPRPDWGEPPPCSGWAAGGSGRAQARIPGATHWTGSPRPPPPRRPSPSALRLQVPASQLPPLSRPQCPYLGSGKFECLRLCRPRDTEGPCVSESVSLPHAPGVGGRQGGAQLAQPSRLRENCSL